MIGATGIEDRLGRHVFAEVDDSIAVVFQYDFDNIFADIMHIVPYRRKNNRAAIGGRFSLGLQYPFDFGKRNLCGLRGPDQLWQKQFLRFKTSSHLVQCADKILIDHVKRRFTGEQFFCQSQRFRFQSVDNRRQNRRDGRRCLGLVLYFTSPDDPFPRPVIVSRQHTVGGQCIRHTPIAGIGNRGVQSVGQCHL